MEHEARTALKAPRELPTSSEGSRAGRVYLEKDVHTCSSPKLSRQVLGVRCDAIPSGAASLAAAKSAVKRSSRRGKNDEMRKHAQGCIMCW